MVEVIEETVLLEDDLDVREEAAAGLLVTCATEETSLVAAGAAEARDDIADAGLVLLFVNERGGEKLVSVPC